MHAPRLLLILAAAPIALSPACSKEQPAPTPERAAATTAAVTATARAVATATATAAPTASAAAAPAPAASSNVVRSARPTTREWCEAPIATLGFEGTVGGDWVAACKMIEVREWLMLWCPQNGQRTDGKHLGNYDRALPGGGSIATDAELAAAVGANDVSDAVVVSLRPGTKAKPTFTYRPLGHPEWLREEAFSVELPADANGLDGRLFNGGRMPTFTKRSTDRCEAMAAEEKAKADAKTAAAEKERAAEDAKVLEDVPDLAAAPADDKWDAEKEVNVAGSGALGCKTKVIDSWFWMRCEGKVKFSAVDIEKGRRKTQTKASAEEGAAKLLVPYVEGTNLRAKLTYEGGEKFLKLQWLHAKRPLQVGSFVDAR